MTKSSAWNCEGPDPFGSRETSEHMQKEQDRFGDRSADHMSVRLCQRRKFNVGRSLNYYDRRLSRCQSREEWFP